MCFIQPACRSIRAGYLSSVFVTCDISLQQEHRDMLNQVDELRDSAVELMSHGGHYRKIVEPKLALLNQQWEEISDRLKVCQMSLCVLQILSISVCSFHGYKIYVQLYS